MTNVRDVMLPAPPQEVINVPKYIEHHPEIVEKLIYVQRPSPAPEVIVNTVEELMPQETIYEEQIRHVPSPIPPPVYQEVVHNVQAPPPHWAVPNKVIPDGPVIKEDYRVIRPAETTVRMDSPAHVPEPTYT